MNPGPCSRPRLNARQLRALALMDHGPLRVIAGPGTGKTTTVVAMYLRLLEERNLRPGQILLLTFANNAAADLKRRIDAQFRTSYDESWVSTFHSFATRVLTRHGRLHGIEPFRLMNGFEEKALMRRVLSTMEGRLGLFESLRGSEALVQDVLWFIGVLKQNLVAPETFGAQAASSNNPKLVHLAAIFAAYRIEQDRLRLYDFRDVIARCRHLLETDAGLREQLSTRFEHVVVDEYQDVDAAQVQMIQQLVRGHHPHPRLAVVGDPNQAIYAFRGTLPAHIGDLWPFGGATVHLTENYRTYAPILQGAGRLLEHHGLDAPSLDAQRGAPEVPLVIVNHEQNAVDEATAIARQIRELLESYRPRDIALIVRSLRRSGRPLEDALRAAGIPHDAGTSPAYASSEIVRFGVAALNGLAHSDDDTMLVRVIESPFAGVPPSDSRRLLEEAQRRQRARADGLDGRSLLTVLTHTCYLLRDADGARWPLPWAAGAAPEAPGTGDPSAEQTGGDSGEDAARAARNAFFDRVSDAGRDAIHAFTWRWVRLQSAAAGLPPHTLAHRVFADLGVFTLLLGDAIDDGRRAELTGTLRMFLRALEDLDEFNNLLLGRSPTLQDTLGALEQILPEYVDELEGAQPDGDGDRVRVLTVHASKGLEFPVVFMPAMAAQRFPVAARSRSPLLDGAERRWIETTLPDLQPPWPRDDAEFLREEARLGYVGATRAKDLLLLSWADQYEQGEPAAPSAFLSPFGGDHGLAREYTESRRSGVAGPAPNLRQPLDAEARWQPWDGAVTFMADAQESASSIGNYLACPRKYYYAKALGLPTEAGIEADRGTAFHRALAEFHSPAVEAVWRHDGDSAHRLYAECTQRALSDHLTRIRGRLNRNAERNLLARLFGQYFTSEIENAPGRTTVATEAAFTWHPLDDVTVMGYIDRIIVLGEDHEIIDYKTGRGRTAGDIRRELGLGDEPPTGFQMLIYLFGAREGDVAGAAALRPRIAGLWYPREVMKNGIRKTGIIDGDDPIPGYPRASTVHLSGDEIAGRRAAIISTLRDLRTGSFPPTPRHDRYTCLSTWGRGCEFARVCPGRIEEPEGYEAQ